MYCLVYLRRPPCVEFCGQPLRLQLLRDALVEKILSVVDELALELLQAVLGAHDRL